MQIATTTTVYSVRLTPERRERLQELSHLENRKPSDQIRHLIDIAHQQVTRQQRQEQAA